MTREVRLIRRPEDDHLGAPEKDYSSMKIYHQAVLETLDPGVLVLDARDVIISDNPAALRLFAIKEENISGKKIQETSLPVRCPELLTQLALLKSPSDQIAQFEFTMRRNGEEDKDLSVTVKPINAPGGERVGTLIYIEDIGPRHKLQ